MSPARGARERREPLELVVALSERVLLPLVEGGELRPRGVVGLRRALAMAELDPAALGAALPEELALRLERARLRVARGLCPIDVLPIVGGGEWLLVAALHDLLQVDNPSLPGWFGQRRASRLIELAERLIEQAGAPSTLADALGRHTTLSRVLEIVRRDSQVRWWTGSRIFKGAHPPGRLVAWPGLRRVHVREEQLAVTMLAPAAVERAYTRALSRLLAASPLTDLAELGRERPRFALTGSTLALLAHPNGWRLAQRAIRRRWPASQAAALLRERAAEIPLEAARAPALALASELEAWAAVAEPSRSSRRDSARPV